jgi:hypothetical protein
MDERNIFTFKHPHLGEDTEDFAVRPVVQLQNKSQTSQPGLARFLI